MKNDKVYKFWLKLNRLPLAEYVKYQHHFQNLCGGWFRGIVIENGEIKPNFE
jgi:hypothetical protein